MDKIRDALKFSERSFEKIVREEVERKRASLKKWEEEMLKDDEGDWDTQAGTNEAGRESGEISSRSRRP